jgi:hypothetical protein
VVEPSLKTLQTFIFKQITSKSLIERQLSRHQSSQGGFALVLALALGLAMTTMAIAATFVAQSDRSTALQRKTSGSGLFVAEGGMAKMLAQFHQPNNSLLMVRNYDTINPKTGQTYLGPDGVPNSGDEESMAVDEWSGYDLSSKPCFQTAGVGAPNFIKTGSVGSAGTYTLKAYRYDKQKQTGTLFVKGSDQGQESYLTMTVSVKPDLEEFPGILTSAGMGKPALRGRQVLGSTGNIYYPPAKSADPSLTGISAPGDANRASYLNAIWSSAADGSSGDNVEGKIFACVLNPTISTAPQGDNLGAISSPTANQSTGLSEPILSPMATSANIFLGQSTPTGRTVTFTTTGTHYYQADSVTLTHIQDSLKFDTTNGAVYLYVKGPINLSGDAQIINYRTDGQPPRVGDLRIIVVGDYQVVLQDTACLQGVFLYNPIDDLDLFTSNKGCPSGRNTNFEGVAWMEGIFSSKNAVANRNIPNWSNEHDVTVVPNATSGIAVPSDLSSLSDVIDSIDWPVRYRIAKIQSWQRVRL